MNKDKALEDLFLTNRPTFDDNEAFLSALNKRLDAVEFIKQYQEKKNRQYRHYMIAALAIGIVIGCGMMVFALTMQPISLQMSCFQTVGLRFLSDNFRIILISFTSILLAGVATLIFYLFTDFGEMKMATNRRT